MPHIELRSSDNLANGPRSRWDSDNSLKGKGPNKSTKWEKNSRKAPWPGGGRG